MEDMLKKILSSENDHVIKQIEHAGEIKQKFLRLIEDESRDVLNLHEKILEREQRIEELENDVKEVEEFLEHVTKDLD